MSIETRLARLTGLTIDPVDALDRVDEYGDRNAIESWIVYAIAADLAEEQASTAMTDMDVTQVEDIGIDGRRSMQAWLDLADRLRARADELRDDDGPFLVHNRARCHVEAVER